MTTLFFRDLISTIALRNLAMLRQGPLSTSYLLMKTRNTLFPNDNLMGQRRVIPQGEELDKYKTNLTKLTYNFLSQHHLTTVLMLSEKDVGSFIDLISQDSSCNKLFLLLLLEPIVATLISTGR